MCVLCVLCMFYVDWELGMRKKLEGRDFFEQKLVRVGLQETNPFFYRPNVQTRMKDIPKLGTPFWAVAGMKESCITPSCRKLEMPHLRYDIGSSSTSL